MIAKIAFRNIWRNSLRSWVVILSIAIGIWGGLLVISLANGLTKMRQERAIESYVSHIQFHNPDFLELGGAEYHISQAHEVLSMLRADSSVEVAVQRMKFETYVQSARSSSAMILNAVEPEQEVKINNLAELGETGNFLMEFKRKPPIVMGKKLAEKLGVEIKNSVQCSFVDANGESFSAVFKLVDIYTSSNSLYDELNAFVRLDQLKDLIASSEVHEIAVKLKNEKQVSEKQKQWTNELKDVQVDSWREIAPELGFADKMMDVVMTLFLMIIMAALAFGIINTMLMAVLERRKELGMLLCVGMNKRRVFWMIASESVMLAVISAPLGIGLAFITISYLQQIGIDLSFVSAGLRSVGLDSMLYPVIDPIYYVLISILTVSTAILSCLYPAYKALKLNPVETLRTAA